MTNRLSPEEDAVLKAAKRYLVALNSHVSTEGHLRTLRKATSALIRNEAADRREKEAREQRQAGLGI